MVFNRLRGIAGLVLASALTLASCDSPNEPTLTNDSSFRPAPAVVVGTNGQSYTLLVGQIPAQNPTASAWIGPLGGVVVIVGGLKNGQPTFHSILVLPLTVTKNTLFTMTLPTGNNIAVKLRAQQKVGLFGNQLVDVTNNFNLPILLTMSYAWATNLINPSNTALLYDPENGSAFQPVPGLVNLGALLYIAPLSHFSKYALAEN